MTTRQERFLARVVTHLSDTKIPQNAERLAEELHAPVQAVSAILSIGLQKGETVGIGDFWMDRGTFNQLMEAVRQKFGERSFSHKEFRDHLDASRSWSETFFTYLRDRELLEVDEDGIRLLTQGE